MAKKEKLRNTGFQDEVNESQLTIGINYLLIIGIDVYKNLPLLNNAVNDAKAFQALLWKHYQFNKVHTFSLYDESATKDNILDRFDFLLNKITANDNLILYYSGHGELHNATQQGYWIPYEGGLNKRGTYLPNSEVINFFRNIKARHVFAIVDSCFSGSMFRLRKIDYKKARLESVASRWLLTAGREEPVWDGKHGENSPFSAGLLTQLYEHRKSGISVGELCEKILEGVIFNSPQTPRGEPISDVGHKGGQFIFRTKQDKAPIIQQPLTPIGNPITGSVGPGNTKFLKRFVPSLLFLLFISIAWFVSSNGKNTADKKKFDVIAYIYSDESKSEVVKNKSFQISYGDSVQVLKTNTKGQLVLKNATRDLKEETIKLVSGLVGFKKETLSQVIPKHTNTLSFVLQPETRLFGYIYDENDQVIADAKIVINGFYTTISNTNGYYEIAVPFKEGEKKSISVKYKSGRLIYYNNNEILTSKIEKNLKKP